MEHATIPAETLAFDDAGIASLLFGPHNTHLDLLAHASGARLHSRGASVIVEAADPDVRRRLGALFVQLYDLAQRGEAIGPQDMVRAYALLEKDATARLEDLYRDAVFVQAPLKTVLARNAAQRQYLECFRHHEIVFAVGPAGTGKTYLAVAYALSLLLQHRVRRIILTRPAVEAGEKLGFLPGDMAEKVNPYLRPLYDALYDMLPQARVASLLAAGTIEVAPLAFMRGRTLNDAFIILDEAQNTTPEQMKMFLTRLGVASRAAITGDATQIDLPVTWGSSAQGRSGLLHAIRVLRQVGGIAVQRFSGRDVVRHPLVGAIVAAYENYEQNATDEER